ncbi:MAG: M48 family metallopeptidase [bacterium]|nr:M48 family metallopeptidase [bacterium]
MKRRFNIERRRIAKQYTKINRRLMILNLIIATLILVLFLISGLSLGLRNALYGFTNNDWLVILFYLLIFSLGVEILTLPISFYDGYIIEHRFSLSNQTVSAWLKHKAKGFLVSFVLGIIFIEILYLCLRKTPSTWWIWMSLIWIVFTVVLSHLTPILLIPIFYKLTPLENKELKTRLLNLSQKAGTKVKGVYRINLSKDTKKTNAGLTGIGGTRCIIVGDTMLSNYSEEEIEVTLAHELGHHYYRHIIKQIASGAIFAFIGFYLTHLVLRGLTPNPSDIAYLPIFLLSFFGFSLLSSPIQNTYSRFLERQADRFSLELSNNPDAFISNMIALSDQNLSDISPHRLVESLLYDHPSPIRRIRFAHNFAKRKGGRE